MKIAPIGGKRPHACWSLGRVVSRFLFKASQSKYSLFECGVNMAIAFLRDRHVNWIFLF